MLAPMTFIVTLGLIMALAAGVIILIRAFGTSGQTRRDLKDGTQTRCPQCKHPNPTHAKFCSRCGCALT
ncbi:MAG TPA: hypothetical protein P5572_21530 [Phycisphaerae bacterium]|nr:hypothetical protein [Phycisphaerae bacterium]